MKKTVDQFPAGLISIPPSKSAAHRALICAALAARAEQGADQGADAAADALAASVGLSLAGASEDVRATAEGIAAIAKNWGRGGEVDCGESGSTLRFLAPVAAMSGGEWAFTGRGRLLARPMGIYAELFEARGALFEHTAEAGGRIRVKGPLPAGEYRLPGDVSSQFITGLLLALPLALPDGGIRESALTLTTALESADYVKLTLEVMRAFGASAESNRGSNLACGADLPSYTIPAGQRYAAPPGGRRIEGDWSQAAFFLCAGALGAAVSVAGLDSGSLQGDRRVLDILAQMGAEISWEGATVRARPPASGRLRGITICARDIPDIVPPLAALACFAEGETRFTGAGRLRFKESDRLAALAGELSKLGAGIIETPDGLIIRGQPPGRAEGARPQTSGDPAAPKPPGWRTAEASAHGDHRIAMALAVFAVAADCRVVIDGAESVAKSYPDFWEDFGKNSGKDLGKDERP
ncbi:MAG: 3-phosphoshikimate 1-carboxyvinyltransferase [Clostridiales Family XIII bacterium]|jgi:3-phosphoshikimate 1-carboxyvinyltransferase|nr:3-phosphoshikimate 1-carboxyvinyltransferase [Clostridiales Family XIII bacterium]